MDWNKLSADEKIERLAHSANLLALRLQDSNEVIARLTAEIERLKGEVALLKQPIAA